MSPETTWTKASPHAYFLTFTTAADRDAYLVSPPPTRSFGASLGPSAR